MTRGGAPRISPSRGACDGSSGAVSISFCTSERGDHDHLAELTIPQVFPTQPATNIGGWKAAFL